MGERSRCHRRRSRRQKPKNLKPDILPESLMMISTMHLARNSRVLPFAKYMSWLIRRALLALSICSALPFTGLPANAQTPVAGLPHVVDARVLSTPDRARLIVDLSGTAEFAVLTLQNPDRIAIAIDVGAVDAAALEQPPADSKGLISAFSVGQPAKGRARVEITLATPAQVQQAYMLQAIDGQPARLVVDIIPDTPERFAARAAADRAVADIPAAAPQPEPAALAPVTTPPGKPARSSQARPLIVIDPGHGGIDGGAEAPNGAKEKDIVLAFALELQRLLVATGRFDVALTRNDDTYLRLEDRVALARQNKADLFISVHADTFQDSTVRGASIYVRDARATDILDKVLAENENRSDLVAGFAPAKSDAQVVDILVDLMRRETRRQSYFAARDLLANLEPSTRLRRIPLRQADFFVLQAPDVPSVLVELGFLSNTKDIANLTQGGWRDQTAQAIARGVSTYFDGLAQN